MRWQSWAALAVVLSLSAWVINNGLGARLPQADLRFGNLSEPQTLDPATMTGVPEGRIARALYEGLTYPNLDDLTQPKPGVAHSWTVSPDGKTYTFYLRENAKWSNGAAVTAEHFLFSWRRVLAPNTGSQYAELLWPIQNARAFNQQLFYRAQNNVKLFRSPSTSSPVVTRVSQGALLVRRDVGRKQIQKRSAPLRDKPNGSVTTKAKVVAKDIVVVLDKTELGTQAWYKVKTPKASKVQGEGWIPGDVLVKHSKAIKSKDVVWVQVYVMKQPKLKGWVKQATLGKLNYNFSNPKKGKGLPAWELVGLKALPLKKPLPKGYSSSAEGKMLVFEIKLEHPTAYWTQITSFYSLSPVYPPLVKKRPRSWVLPKYFVGNGPFKLTHWMINELVRAEKNQHYWDKKNVGVNSIHFMAVNERDTQLSMYLSGDLDVVTSVPLPSVQKLLQRKDFYSRLFLATYFYRVNVERPPLNNKYVRQALAYAVDRTSIVKHILRAGQLPAYRLVPPGIRGYPLTKDTPGPRFNPKKARALLRKAGFKDPSKIPPISLLYNTDQQHKQVAEALQKMWRKHLGIRVHLVNKEWKTYLDTVKQREYQLARAGWIGDYTDPNTFLSMFITGGGHNRTGWSNVTYDRFIRLASKERDPSKRMAFFRKAEAVLMEELPILPLYFYNYQNLIHPRIKGHVNNPLNNFDFRRFRRVKGK